MGLLDEALRETLLNLKDHEGWKVVEEYINKQIHFHEQQLLSCSLDKVIEHRSKREALRLVLLFLEERISTR